MINELKNWWNSVPKSQRKGLIVLTGFVFAVFILSFGVIIGSSLAKVI